MSFFSKVLKKIMSFRNNFFTRNAKKTVWLAVSLFWTDI